MITRFTLGTETGETIFHIFYFDGGVIHIFSEDYLNETVGGVGEFRRMLVEDTGFTEQGTKNGEAGEGSVYTQNGTTP